MGAEGSIAYYLGGPKTLGRKLGSMQDWHALIRAGIPAGAIERLKNAIAVSDESMAELLGVSPKTLSRARSDNARLDTVVSDRLFRVAQVAALAREVLETEAGALTWLKRAQSGLAGRIPLTLLTTHAGIDEVEQLLLRIEHSVYA